LGTVRVVSADRLSKRESGKPYYSARIEVDPESAGDLPGGLRAMVAGMPVEVIIETRPRTLADYILMPIATSMRRAFRED
jgi:epimerase transport system membrane fusion protein